ncbi:hypothetical protein KX928_22465 [Roseobacter sp. YSTF-M11]|uniref:Lipoprotein n=1 Tax=Roseobacter insulae TaxID=2859783 RepID=A0A9X1FZQ7_9RHOB|nr:hypothetical protein [Roseobacter insulae]MBW4710561.1 hypothetical protein [Roseobacter insulae]
MRILIVLAAVTLLTGCAISSPFEASPEEIAAKVYVPEGPPKLTIFTMVNNSSGSGGHTSLMVSGSQQVIFDPAGSFVHAQVAERGDVLYGMSPAWVQAYKSAHARSTHHVVTQEIEVTPAQAERALQLVQASGAIPGAFCTNATSDILRKIPGFEDISVTFFPINLMNQIAQRPGVKTDKYYENDEGDVRDGIEAAQS